MPLPRVQPIIPVLQERTFRQPRMAVRIQVRRLSGPCYIEQGSGCRFISRRGNILSRFDVLCDQVARELDVDDAILDGEVIAADETGAPSSTTSYEARGGTPTSHSTFCGSKTVQTFAPSS